MTECEHCQQQHEGQHKFCPITGKLILSRLFPEGYMFEGKYRIGKVIGVGGMGVVFDAMHELLNKRMAIKVMLPGADTDENMTARMVREARAASATGHKNIVQVTDMGWAEEESLYVVMEYVDGPTLLDLINDIGWMPLPRAARLTQQVLSGLATVHKKGIIHRDLKPENLMLVKEEDGEEIIKILDFGISKILTAGSEELDLTAAGLVVGSPKYMSPEQAMGSSEVDHRTDLYSTAAMLYLLVTGAPPIDKESINAMLAATISGDIEPPSRRNPDLPRAFDEVMMTALAKEPRYRYSDATAFKEALEPFTRAHSGAPQLSDSLPKPSPDVLPGLTEMPPQVDESLMVALDEIAGEPDLELDTDVGPRRTQDSVEDEWLDEAIDPSLFDDPRFAPPEEELETDFDLDNSQKINESLLASPQPREGEPEAAPSPEKSSAPRKKSTPPKKRPPTHPPEQDLGEALLPLSRERGRRGRAPVDYGQARKPEQIRRFMVGFIVVVVGLAVVKFGLDYHEKMQEEERLRLEEEERKRNQIQKVKIFFNVKPGNAEIFVDGVRLAMQPLWLIKSDSEYKVKFKAEGYLTKIIYVRPMQDYSLQIELESKSAKKRRPPPRRAPRSPGKRPSKKPAKT